MFISPTNPNNVVIAASWIPFEGPEGGPNYWEWDPTAQYSINVDNDGDAVADFTYTLTAETSIPNGNTFLYNTFDPVARRRGLEHEAEGHDQGEP